MLRKLLSKTGIIVNDAELKLQLLSHPSYPSLHALTGVLEHFQIPSLALRLPIEKETLPQLPKCFIAQITIAGNDHLVLVEKKKEVFKITGGDTGRSTLSTEAFLNQWTGIVLVIEKDERVEHEESNRVITIAKGLAAISSLLLLAYISYDYQNTFAFYHFLLSSLGLVLSISIVHHASGMHSSATNSFCNLSEKTSCDAVLNSKGATLFGFLKLSDVSIVTFCCFCLCWVILFANKMDDFVIMPIVSLLAFPFVIYSVYYQYKVIKKWCPLCLGITSILTAQFLLALISYHVSDLLVFKAENLSVFVLSLLITSVLWNLFRPILKKNINLEKLEVEHYKFKRNYALFKASYDDSQALTTTTSIKNEIVLGPKQAPIKLTLVTSPLCYYCKKAHQDIEHLLKAPHHKINVTIRFHVDVDQQNTQLYKITSELLRIYQDEGEIACLKALHEVYKDDADLTKWLADHNSEGIKSYDTILRTQAQWCKANNIHFTPALYLNDRAFSKAYERTDLLHFIEDIEEDILAQSKISLELSKT
ncbi:vitamin K epoxide reductase family protein [Winogradskyella sp.]|uniref:vitamin K epoxide reductase family protein n=1 Tax=Winogradskyella sp. TaxID=1883156 RepID=UPI003BAACD99